MAFPVVDQKSVQARITTTKGVGNHLLSKLDRGGYVQAVRFDWTNQTGGTLANGTVIQLATVGPGLILPQSTIAVSAMGASRLLDLGFQKYTDVDGNPVSADQDGILDGVDISSAVNSSFIDLGSTVAAPVYELGLELTGQTDILATVTGGDIPNAATIKGILLMVMT
jgi:hypothetical protein